MHLRFLKRLLLNKFLHLSISVATLPNSNLAKRKAPLANEHPKAVTVLALRFAQPMRARREFSRPGLQPTTHCEWHPTATIDNLWRQGNAFVAQAFLPVPPTFCVRPFRRSKTASMLGSGGVAFLGFDTKDAAGFGFQEGKQRAGLGEGD